MANVNDLALTTTTSAVFVPEIWSANVIGAAEFAAVIQKRVNTDWKDDMAIGGTYHVPRLSNLNTQSKSSGISNTITFEAPTESKQDIAISTHEYAAFLIENVLEVQANQDLRMRYTNKIGYALARGRDKTLAALFASLSTNVGTLNVELTSDDYLSAWTNLATAGLLEDSPDAGDDFSVILSPQAYAAALKVDVFINRLYNTAGDAITRAKTGDIYGMQTFISNLTTVDGSGHDCVAMHREAIAMILQKEVPVASDYLIRNLAYGVVGWNLYGTAVVSFPPETPPSAASPETYTAVANRGVWLKTV